MSSSPAGAPIAVEPPVGQNSLVGESAAVGARQNWELVFDPGLPPPRSWQAYRGVGVTEDHHGRPKRAAKLASLYLLQNFHCSLQHRIPRRMCATSHITQCVLHTRPSDERIHLQVCLICLFCADKADSLSLIRISLHFARGHT